MIALLLVGTVVGLQLVRRQGAQTMAAFSETVWKRQQPHQEMADGVLIAAADELHADSKISDDTWKALAKRYDKRQLIELCMLVGQYHLVAMTLNSLGVQRDEGVEGFPSA